MNKPNIRVFGLEASPASPRILPMTRGTNRRDPPDRPPKKRKAGPTLRQVYERHVKPGLLAKARAGSTVRDIERALERWEAYWTTSQFGSEPSSSPSTTTSKSEPSASPEPKGERIVNPFPSQQTEQAIDRPTRIPVQLRVRGVKRRHLEEFQIHLQTCKSQRGKPFAKSTINGELGSIRQILCAAESHALLRDGRPRIAKLPAGAATKFYVSREQMNALWEATEHATWPRLPGMRTAEWWQCALTLLWLYGFRTQELLAFQTGKSKLDWSCIHLEAETPNPAGQAQNALGWLVYVPQKQKWAKPEPLYLPLTAHSRAAVDWLASAARSQCEGQLPPDRPLFPWSKAHKALYGQWLALQRRAKVQTKAGTPYELKHLRKSAATYLEGHWPGLGEAVVGWADRSHQASQPSQVMKVHYQVDEIVMVDKLATYPVPECFTTLLSKPSAQMRLFE